MGEGKLELKRKVAMGRSWGKKGAEMKTISTFPEGPSRKRGGMSRKGGGGGRKSWRKGLGGRIVRRTESGRKNSSAGGRPSEPPLEGKARVGFEKNPMVSLGRGARATKSQLAEKELRKNVRSLCWWERLGKNAKKQLLRVKRDGGGKKCLRSEKRGFQVRKEKRHSKLF